MIVWTNGDQGWSSAVGLFMELGPYEGSIVDQPVDVGFSYAEHGERLVSRFLVMFFLLKGCDNPV